MTAIQTVPFHGLSLSAVLVNGVPFVAIRPICAALGIDYESQRQRIKRDANLSSTTCVMKAVAEDGKMRATLWMPLNHLNGWLFGVDVARVRPELRERMSRYRAECFDVLARHFGLSQSDGLSVLSGRMRDVELSELASFRQAQTYSKGMNQRRKEKRRLAGELATLRAEVQMTLALIEGGAA